MGHTSFAMNAQDIMNALSDSEYSVGNLGTPNNHDAQRKSAANLNVLERGIIAFLVHNKNCQKTLLWQKVVHSQSLWSSCFVNYFSQISR